jgi:hypothetical protein
VACIQISAKALVKEFVGQERDNRLRPSGHARHGRSNNREIGIAIRHSDRLAVHDNGLQIKTEAYQDQAGRVIRFINVQYMLASVMVLVNSTGSIGLTR